MIIFRYMRYQSTKILALIGGFKSKESSFTLLDNLSHQIVMLLLHDKYVTSGIVTIIVILLI